MGFYVNNEQKILRLDVDVDMVGAFGKILNYYRGRQQCSGENLNLPVITVLAKSDIPSSTPEKPHAA